MLCIALLPLVGPVQALAGPNFHAELETSAPLWFDGVVSTDSEGAWNLAGIPAGPPVRLTDQNALEIVVREHNRSSYRIHFHRQELTVSHELVPQNGSATRAPARFGIAALEYGSSLLRPGAIAVPTRPSARAQVEGECDLWPRPSMPLLSVECEARRIEVSSQGQLRIINGTVRVVVQDPTREDNGHAYEYEAGTFTAPNRTHPGRTDTVQREIWVRVGKPFSWNPATPLSARIDAPAFAGAGGLRTPDAKGLIVWSEQRRIDPPSTTANGEFLFMAPRSGAVFVDGFAAQDQSAPRLLDGLPGAAIWIALAAALLPLAWLLRRFGIAPLALFARLMRAEILGHPGRQRIVELVRASPGITVQEGSASLAMGRKTFDYHAKMLARHGLIVRRRVGGRTALFLPGSDPASQTRFVGLRHPQMARLYAALQAPGTQTQTDLAQRLGVQQSYVSRLLQRMQRLGLVRIERAGRRSHYIALDPRSGEAHRGEPL